MLTTIVTFTWLSIAASLAGISLNQQRKKLGARHPHSLTPMLVEYKSKKRYIYIYIYQKRLKRTPVNNLIDVLLEIQGHREERNSFFFLKKKGRKKKGDEGWHTSIRWSPEESHGRDHFSQLNLPGRVGKPEMDGWQK